jgi:hypothetical protein
MQGQQQVVKHGPLQLQRLAPQLLIFGRLCFGISRLKVGSQDLVEIELHKG